MQRLEVSGAMRPIYVSLGVKRLRIRRHVSVHRNHHQAKYENTVLVHSESAHTMGSHIVYNRIDIEVHVNTIVNNMGSHSVCTL